MPLDPDHRTLLSAAADRQDQLIARPAVLSARAAKALLAKLIDTNVARDVLVLAEQPHWHQDARGPVGLSLTPAGRDALGLDPVCPDAAVAGVEVRSIAPRLAPRRGSKRALIVALLQRDQGVTLDEVIAATGWLAHSSRAALTGLRHRGCVIAKTRNADDRTVYRIVGEASGALTSREAINNAATNTCEAVAR